MYFKIKINLFQGAHKLEELLDKAKEFIPENAWSKTPLAMRATAGLRLLPAEQAEALLHEVRVDSKTINISHKYLFLHSVYLYSILLTILPNHMK